MVAPSPLSKASLSLGKEMPRGYTGTLHLMHIETVQGRKVSRYEKIKRGKEVECPWVLPQNIQQFD